MHLNQGAQIHGAQIHANPLRRGLVTRLEDYEWSSARWYAGIRPVKIEMDEQVLVELSRGSEN